MKMDFTRSLTRPRFARNDDLNIASLRAKRGNPCLFLLIAIMLEKTDANQVSIIQVMHMHFCRMGKRKGRRQHRPRPFCCVF